MYHALPSFSAHGAIVGLDALIMGHYAPMAAHSKPDRIGGIGRGTPLAETAVAERRNALRYCALRSAMSLAMVRAAAAAGAAA